ncbi:MAG: TolC family protein [Alistipes sp.]
MKIGIISVALCAVCLSQSLFSPLSAQELQPHASEPAAGVCWSLSDCISYAQRNNIEVQQHGLKIEQNDVSLSTARLSRLPDLNASLGYNASFGRGTSADNTYKTETLHSGSLDVSSSLPVFQGFRINRQIKGVKLDLAAAVQDMERVREDVAVNVMTLYLQVLYNKELVGIAERQLELSTLQATRSRELVAAGKQPESAIYEGDALRANDELTLTQARNNQQSALLDLSQALNRESASGFDVVAPDFGALLDAVLNDPYAACDDIYAYAVENRPHVKAEQLRLQSSENAVRIARSALYPTISLRGGYGTGVYSSLDENFWPQFRKNSSEFVGVSMGIPIFNRRATRNNIRAAQISTRTQQLAVLNTEQTLRKQIEQASYNAHAADAKYRSATSATASAQVAFGYEQQRSAAGRSTIFDFNDAKTRLEKAEAELAQSKYELIFRRKILDYYRGESLSF